MLVDPSLPGGGDFVGAVREATGARVIVCSSDCGQDAVLARAPGGRGRLPAQGRADARRRWPRRSRAAANGTGVVTPDLLEHLLAQAARERRDAAARRGRLTDREQQVLALIAAGHPTREVALELSYSERTVKNVLHDVVTKLNARSRSQAVAFAVREGLI